MKITRCLICGKGETAGVHDWKTGWSKKPTDNMPNGHMFRNDNRRNRDKGNEYGFKDKFVMNKHKEGD